MSVLFKNVTAVLMDQDHTVLKNAYIGIDGSKILSVGTSTPAGDFTRVIDGRGGILMPGLINAHTHVPMTAMRGYGDGHDLQEWLNDFIFPVEARWDGRAVRACADLGLMEMIASGTTCIADMYMHATTVAEAVAASGISANLGTGATLFEEGFSSEDHPACKAMVELYETWHGYDAGRILVDGSIHGEYTSQPPLWEWMAGFAKDHGLGMHIHISETKSEHEGCKARRGGLTPIQVLDKYGAWDVRAIAAHCVWTEPDDWAIMAQKGVSAIHNPCSNLKLGSGVAPIVDMRKNGVNVAMGTDGVSSNNNTDMFEETKLAAILHNGIRRDPSALTAWEALELATVNAAKALGRNTGCIIPGKDADLILLDPDAPELVPCHDAANTLAYAARGSDVVLNMCRGSIIYENGVFQTIDAEKVLREVRGYAVPLLFGARSR